MERRLKAGVDSIDGASVFNLHSICIAPTVQYVKIAAAGAGEDGSSRMTYSADVGH